jgi:DNA-binding winged helix-turn-helix (wHTH) protein
MKVEPRPRYRFGELVLSPGRRLLLRGGAPVPLPPRYFDLLLLLVAERERVVGREEIHQLVWGGVAVTDGAFTQAVRTLRRTLGDDHPRAPLYLRTAARHGYQFVGEGVVEEDDGAPLEAVARGGASVQPAHDGPASAAASAVVGPPPVADRSSTADDASSAGPAASPLAAAALTGLVGGGLGAAGAGVIAALSLGCLLVLAGGGHWRLVPVLCTLGAAIGAWGGGLVGAGIAVGDSRTVPARLLGTVALGAAGGGFAGAVGHALVGWAMSELLGREVTALGGALEGVVLGGAVALGFALAARTGDDHSSARGVPPLAILAAALAGAVAAGLLAAAGARLSGGSIDAIADALKGARIMAPLGTYLGEPEGERGAGPATRLAVSLLEGGFFGAGVAWGLRRAGRYRASARG